MDQDQPSSLFDTEMDSNAQAHLLSISKWAKFISVTGFVIGALVLLGLATGGREILNTLTALTSLGQTNLAGAFIAIAIIVLALAGTWIYFLFKASAMIRRGLQSRNTNDLAEGFKALRTYFIFSIIISMLSVLGSLFSMLNT